MQPLIYHDLIEWYRLLDPTDEHRDEAECYRAALEQGASPRAETLLELGAGAGNNAFHLKERFRCTLSDLSEGMLGLSRELNPEVEHVRGDMRTLRLDRTFDAVLVHDAVNYMTTREDLRAAIETAFVHTRPGGAALFAPDAMRETFHDSTLLLTGEAGDRALRCIEWSWDPDPSDTTHVTEYAFLLRRGTSIQAVHDHHLEGLFPRTTWLELFSDVGYRVELIDRPLDDEGTCDQVFLCRR